MADHVLQFNDGGPDWCINCGQFAEEFGKHMRWMEVEFTADYPEGTPYWRWQVPGYTTAVEFDWWWMPRPDMAALDGTAQKEAGER